MARYTGAVCRQCRRENQKLFLKGDRCYSDKCALARRSFVPGQHGQNQARKKVSEYGLQLARETERQNAYYGVLESQFAHVLMKWPSANPGITGENSAAEEPGTPSGQRRATVAGFADEPPVKPASW